MYTLCDLIYIFVFLLIKPTRSYSAFAMSLWSKQDRFHDKFFFLGGGVVGVKDSNPNLHIVHRVGQTVGHMLAAHVEQSFDRCVGCEAVVCWLWVGWYVGHISLAHWQTCWPACWRMLRWGWICYFTNRGLWNFSKSSKGKCREQLVINIIFSTFLVLA